MRTVREHVRAVIAVVTAATAIVVITGCSGRSRVDSESNGAVSTAEARQSVQDIVDRTASSLEGDWEVYSGPSVEQCSKSDGSDGAAYRYIKALAKPTGEPEADIAVVEKLWEETGITTQPYESGGDDPILGLRGAGGPTTSISFLADTRRYTVSATSECADGDAVEMQRNGE
jgi:hypothetical protein